MEPSCVLPWAALHGSGLGVPSLVTWRPWWADFQLYPHADLGSRAWLHRSLTSGDTEASVAELGLYDRRASAWATPTAPPYFLQRALSSTLPPPACFPVGTMANLTRGGGLPTLGLVCGWTGSSRHCGPQGA